MKNFDEFQIQASKVLGLDLGSYKIKRVERRVESLMRRRNIPDFSTCLQLLKKDQQFRNDFLNHFTINTSEFFRNPTNFITLQNKIFPELLSKNNRIKIWSAPCSNGCEPYSLAIILDEMGLKPHQFEILGIDLDPNILQAAKKGVYNSGSLKNVNPARLTKYFTKIGSEMYTINDKIKQMITFNQFDILKGNYVKNWDLILCRNLFIYFTQDVKDTLTHKFVEALSPNGILFLGNTEFIFEPDKYNLRKVISSFYEKV